MLKTTDFKSTSHYYKYDSLNRMTGHGADIDADDETYTWVCCTRLSAYTDALGTASLSYDGLNRLTSFTDSNGNTVGYEYDTMGRITKLTPAQGTNYRTEYTYNKNGSVSQVRIYDAGSSADTTYTYSTSTGRLTERHFPTVSSQYIKTAYSYDAYGRLEYETVTRESGGTTNLYKTQYAYSRLTFGIQLERIEQTYSGSWTNSYKTQYQWDTLGRQTYEQRLDYVLGNWVNRYDITQTYDKNGNRTGYDKNVAGGYTSSYGKQYNLTYTFDNVNSINSISDADDANYSCTVTCDANMNITQVDESTSGIGAGALHTYFEYDALNRLTVFKTKKNLISGMTTWNWTKRVHSYDATGRLVKSTWKNWNDGSSEPSGDTLEHVYAGAKHVQNYDGTNYGAVWHWAGAENEHMGPLFSPNADTASQKTYNLANGGADIAGGAGGPAGGAGGMTPQKRTFTNPTSEGDQRHLFGQGRPMAKDSSGSGSNWATGTTSQPTGAHVNAVESRLFFEGTVSSTDMSRATDAREKDRIGIFGTGLSYAGSYGRVTSESIGRDLNPLGRGAGQALVGGTVALGMVGLRTAVSQCSLGSGNSINNANFDSSTLKGNRYDSSCISQWLTDGDKDNWSGCWNCLTTCACSNKDKQCSDKEWQDNPELCIDHYCGCHVSCPDGNDGCCKNAKRQGSGKSCCASECIKCSDCSGSDPTAPVKPGAGGGLGHNGNPSNPSDAQTNRYILGIPSNPSFSRTSYVVIPISLATMINTLIQLLPLYSTQQTKNQVIEPYNWPLAEPTLPGYFEKWFEKLRNLPTDMLDCMMEKLLSGEITDDEEFAQALAECAVENIGFSPARALVSYLSDQGCKGCLEQCQDDYNADCYNCGLSIWSVIGWIICLHRARIDLQDCIADCEPENA